MWISKWLKLILKVTRQLLCHELMLVAYIQYIIVQYRKEKKNQIKTKYTKKNKTNKRKSNKTNIKLKSVQRADLADKNSGFLPLLCDQFHMHVIGLVILGLFTQDSLGCQQNKLFGFC